MLGRQFLFAATIALLACVPAMHALAQSPLRTETNNPPPGAAPANTTVVPRVPSTGPQDDTPGLVSFVLAAHLTDDSQRVEQGLVWRIFKERPGSGAGATLLSTQRTPAPTVRLEPGAYIINVTYGRAHLTRRVVVTPQTSEERFVLNAGGLRLVPVLASGEPANEQAVTFDVQSDERDKHGQRTNVITGAKPGVVLRLNAGIYSIVSTYGDANAIARSDVSVEAGKLSEITLVHSAAKVSFLLVTRPGGDAVSDTQWNVASTHGETVKESAGALPTHYLAPGNYVVSARHAGRVFRRQFSVKSGETARVEVVMP
jgi:hypothetical protein